MRLRGTARLALCSNAVFSMQAVNTAAFSAKNEKEAKFRSIAKLRQNAS